MAISFFILILAGLYSVRQNEQVQHALCQQTIDNRQGNRLTWNAARTLLLRNASSPESVRETNAFFDGILAVIPPLKCINNRPEEDMG